MFLGVNAWSRQLWFAKFGAKLVPTVDFLRMCPYSVKTIPYLSFHLIHSKPVIHVSHCRVKPFVYFLDDMLMTLRSQEDQACEMVRKKPAHGTHAGCML